jgi:hypothetical protein
VISKVIPILLIIVFEMVPTPTSKGFMIQTVPIFEEWNFIGDDFVVGGVVIPCMKGIRRFRWE